MAWWVLPVAGSVTGGWLRIPQAGVRSATQTFYILLYMIMYYHYFISGYSRDWGVDPLWALPVIKAPSSAPGAGWGRCWRWEPAQSTECQVPVSARLCLRSPNRIVGFQALSKTMEGTAELLGMFRAASPALLWVLPLLLANHPLRSISDCSVLKLQGSNWFSLRRKS